MTPVSIGRLRVRAHIGGPETLSAAGTCFDRAGESAWTTEADS